MLRFTPGFPDAQSPELRVAAEPSIERILQEGGTGAIGVEAREALHALVVGVMHERHAELPMKRAGTAPRG